MPRHDPSFGLGHARSAGEFEVRVSAVSYLSQFPVTNRVAAVSGIEVQLLDIESEPPRLPVAHRFSS